MRSRLWDNPYVRRLTLTGVWMIALGLAITVTWQIVSAADDQVSERPLAPLNVAAPVITDLQTTTTSTGPTSSAITSAVGAGSTTTEVLATSTADTEWQTRSVQTTGGNVLLRYRPGEVAYQSATPAPGYQVEVEKPGPPEVKVEFESQSDKVEIEAGWEDGDLEVNVSEEDED
jgi:hypothetical protein